MAVKYFYGPVVSRRLGFSLGVDIVPLKTCSFDCIYCQLGSAPQHTLQRAHWVDMQEFRRQLRAVMKTGPMVDYITISGSGEPTLHKDLDKIIAVIKTITKKRYPVCVITNASLLHDRKVRQELAQADLIIPSLDAARVSTFRAINKPHENISFENVISGLMALRKEYKGKFWLEIMLVAGRNDSPGELRAFREIVGKLNPDKVQLNLPLRPTPQTVAIPSPAQIRKIQVALSGTVPVEVVHDVEPKRKRASVASGSVQAVLGLLRVRPETFGRLKEALGLKEQTLRGILKELSDKKQIATLERSKKIFYTIDDSRKRKRHPGQSAGRR